MIMQFTQNQAVSELHVGGKLSMYGGMIDGEYVAIEPNKHLELKWRFKDWGEAYSTVKIDLEDCDEDVR